MTVGVRIDGDDPTPPYEQIRRQVATLVDAGTLGPGTRLPPVRQLAADLSLAAGTVARAYQELEKAGYVRSRRGGGTTVSEGRHAPTPAERRARLARVVGDAVQQATLLGATDDEVRTALEDALRARTDVTPRET